MRYSLLITLTSAIAVTGCSSSDSYDYVNTPKADQIYDLLDDDSDGVINARDFCPGTPVGATINNDGCGEVIRLEEERSLKILFAHDSDYISPVFQSQLISMASFLEKYQTASIEIQGFASKVGTSDYNKALSERRADAVRNELIAYNIAPDRVRIIGFGDTVLVNEGTKEVDHAVNRRVTATVVGLDEKVVEEWTIFTRKEK